MSLTKRPPGATPAVERDAADRDTDRLEAALRSLPRAAAAPGFTQRLMGRVAATAAPRRTASLPWLWLGAAAAAAVLALVLVPETFDRWLARGSGGAETVRAARIDDSELDAQQVARLRARRDELQEELRALRQLAAELPPVVGVEGPSADYLIDLGDLGPNSLPSSAGAVPAVYRPRP
jgi:hypothetical protein